MKSLVAFVLLIFSQCAFSQQAELPQSGAHPVIAPRELIVLKPSVDGIWGTWITAVIHKGTAPEEVTINVNIPRESINFQAGEGIEKKDLKLESDGIKVQKIFAPGVNVVSVLFEVPAHYGTSRLTLVPKRELPEISVMTPKGMLSIKADGLVAQPDDRQDGERYDVFGASTSLSENKEFVIDVSGVPEGRSRLWILGSVIALLLVLSAGWYAWRTRPVAGHNSKEEREEAFA